MEIFLTGATRVLGHPVVQRLVDAGHRVRALSRSEENAAALRQLGADPVPASLFEVESFKPALAGSDATLHLAASIPLTMKMGAMSCFERRLGSASVVSITPCSRAIVQSARASWRQTGRMTRSLGVDAILFLHC